MHDGSTDHAIPDYHASAVKQVVRLVRDDDRFQFSRKRLDERYSGWVRGRGWHGRRTLTIRVIIHFRVRGGRRASNGGGRQRPQLRNQLERTRKPHQDPALVDRKRLARSTITVNPRRHTSNASLTSTLRATRAPIPQQCATPPGASPPGLSDCWTTSVDRRRNCSLRRRSSAH